MSARKIRNSWWVDFRVRRTRYRMRSPLNSCEGAKAYEITLRRKLADGEDIRAKEDERKTELPLFGEFAREWFDKYVQTNNRASEQKSKLVTLRAHLVPFFGETRLDRITNLQVEEYKSDKLKSGLAPKTINNHLTVLGKALRTAQEWVGLGSIPKTRFLKVPPQRFDFLSPIESKQLLDGIRDEMWHAMVLVAMRTGLRLGELVGLDWSDIDLDARLLTVRRSVVRGIVGPPKSNRVRYIPLIDEVCRDLRRVEPQVGTVFWRRNRNRLHHETSRLALHKMCDAVGLRRIGWHTLRHTFASHLAAAGVSMRAIQDLLGHSDLQTTMRYAHLGPSALRGAVEVLDSQPSTCLGQPVGNISLERIGLQQQKARVSGLL